jgi:hypothetical protein
LIPVVANVGEKKGAEGMGAVRRSSRAQAQQESMPADSNSWTCSVLLRQRLKRRLETEVEDKYDIWTNFVSETKKYLL